MNRHNQSAPWSRSLTLSAVDGGQLRCAVLPHAHDPRLCVTCSRVRFRALNPPAARPVAVRAEAIAAAIRDARGNVWPAIAAFGISYGHAARIRRGWRPGGVTALPLPYRSRGWLSGRRPGWTAEAVA